MAVWGVEIVDGTVTVVGMVIVVGLVRVGVEVYLVGVRYTIVFVGLHTKIVGGGATMLVFFTLLYKTPLIVLVQTVTIEPGVAADPRNITFVFAANVLGATV